MKKRLILALILFIVFAFGIAEAKKPQKSEFVTFVDDLVGGQDVVGGFPNAGPWPEYTMTLSGVFPPAFPPGMHEGQLFMNVLGTHPKSYIVQFWTDTMFLEVRGGTIHKDPRNKITTVTFTDEECEIWIGYVGERILADTVQVSFIVTRAWQ